MTLNRRGISIVKKGNKENLSGNYKNSEDSIISRSATMQWLIMVATMRLIDPAMKNSLCLTCVAWSLTVNSKYKVVGKFEEKFHLL